MSKNKKGNLLKKIMITDIKEIQSFLVECLKAHSSSFKIIKETEGHFEVHGTIEAMQGRKKVDGIYFASIILKPKDVRLYFFPIYTHVSEFEDLLSDGIKKCLKGKSCFHIKKLDSDLEHSFSALIAHGVKVYQSSGLLV